MSHNNTPAPKKLRRAKQMLGTTLPPGALAVVDDLVGTFVGATRSEVLCFIVTSWITEHFSTVLQIPKKDRRRSNG